MNYPFVALMICGCAYALLAGGWPERIGVAAFAIGSHFTFIVGSASSTPFQSIEAGVFVIDVVAFTAFGVLALRANRFWPIWACALVGMGLLGHLARFAEFNMEPWTYAVSISIWSYVILALIAIGTLNHQRRLERFGADRSWST